MRAASAVQTAAATSEKLKVFVSYSRHDLAFTLRLVEALEARALNVLIDTRDLPLAVEFQKELLGFIRQADTVVYVVSPDSIASPWVVWEIQQVELLSKRLAPVVARNVQDAAVPEGIRKINYVLFTGANAEGDGFEKQVDALAAALKTDIEWIKAHTRWAERGRLWHEQGQRPAQLLRGHELEQAEGWSVRQPLEAPPLTPLQREYISASRKSATRRQRYWISGSALVSAFTAGLAIVAFGQKQAADASAAEARRTLALADQRKAADLSAQQPGRALGYLARAIRNHPENPAIGRRTLYLIGEHPHLLPISVAGSLPTFAAQRAVLVPEDGENPAEVTSPDGSWALNLAEQPARIRRKGEPTFVDVDDDLKDLGISYGAAAFPDNSRYAAVTGAIWGDFGGTAEIRIVSDFGGVLGKHTFNEEMVEQLGLSPDGRLLFVSLLSPPVGGGRGDAGTRRTVLMSVSPIDTARVELVELRSIERAVKSVRFSADSRTVDVDGRMFSVGPTVADESLPVLTPKEVRFSSDSSRMDVLSGDNQWKSFDAVRGSETNGDAANAVPHRAPPAEIKAAKSDEGIEVTANGQVIFKASDPRIVLAGASEDASRLIWIRDDGSAQTVALSTGGPREQWHPLRALYGHPWHSGTREFLTVIDSDAVRWTRIYYVEDDQGATWKRALGQISPDSTDTGTSTTIALHPNGHIAAIGKAGLSHAEVSLIDVATGEPLLDSINVGSQELSVFFSRDGSSLFVHGFSSGSGVGKLEILDITNGLPLTKTRFYAGPFVERPDGRRMVALGGFGDGAEVLFDILGDVTPLPSWLADLAEGVGGWRLTEQGVLHSLSAEEQSATIAGATTAATARPDRWAAFARWYLSDDADPTISPYSPMPRSQLAKKDAEALAASRQPSNPLPLSAVPAEVEAAPKPPLPAYATGAIGAPSEEAPGTESAAATDEPAEVQAAPAPVQTEPAAPIAGEKAAPAAAATAKEEDYVVQVGAFLQKTEAEKHIALISGRVSDLLHDHPPVVSPPLQGSSKFYRARFTRFEETQARDTCREMKRQKIDCLTAKAE